MKFEFRTPISNKYVLLLVAFVASFNLKAQIRPNNINFESLAEEQLYQASGIRYKTVTQGSDKQLVFMQSAPGQQDSTTWGYVGMPGNYFNGYPNKALVYNYDRVQNGSANPSVGGYGIYRMLFSEAPLSVTGQTIDTLSKLGNFRIKSIYVALGRNFGTESAVPSAVLLNFHGLRNGVSLVRPFITMRSGVENSGSGSIVSGGVTILTYSAMDKHGGRTFTFVSDEWNFIDGLWISTAGTARLPVLVDNIQFEAPIPVAPNVRSTSLTVTEEQTHEATLRWQNSGSSLNRGNWRLLLVKETDDEDELPPSSLLVARPGEIPAAIPRRPSSPGERGLAGAYGEPGTDLGDGWYCVYNDSYSNFPLTVTGLSSGRRYRAVVADYHGARGFQTFMDNPFEEGENAISFQTLGEPPVIVTSGGETTFTESAAGDPVPVAIDEGLAVTDVDSETLASATVAITDNFQSGEDVIAFANDGSTMGNIEGSYDAGLGVLTLTSEGATATLAQWQGALRTVSYSNTSKNPNTGDRTIVFDVHDGGYGSQPATKTVTITDVNNPPVISQPEYIEVAEGEETTVTNISFSDVDAGTGVVKATFSIPDGRGTLQAVTASGVDVTPTGLHTVLLEGTLAAINAFIAAGELRFTPAPADVDEVILTVSINDNGHTGGDGSARQTDSQLPIRVKPIIPNVVELSSTTEDGVYGIGKAIAITVTFDHPVTVTGSPAILLETGETDRSATYHDGSGSSTLAFNYVVQRGDEAELLEYVSMDALSLNGGSIKSAAGTVADLTLPTPFSDGSLGNNTTIRIDGIPPAEPTGLTAITADTEVALLWVANNEQDVVGYRIYSGESANPTHPLTTVAGTTSYTHKDLTNGTRYYYRITAIDEAGNESASAEEVNAIPAAEQTIIFEPLPAATYGDGPVNLVATASSDLPVRFSSSNEEVAEVFQDTEDGNTWKARILRAGTVTITASQPGNTAFLAAKPVDSEWIIEKAAPVITASATQTYVWDGTPKVVAATVEPVALADQLQYSPQRSFTGVGEYRDVRVYLNESANYLSAEAFVHLSITPAPQQDLLLPSRTVTYDGKPHALSVQGLTDDASVSYTINGQRGNSAVNAGSYTVTARVSRPNHADTEVSGTLYINKAVASITAEAVQVQTYTGSPIAVHAILNHDETMLSYSPAQAYTEAGNYEVNVAAAETDNYHAVSANVILLIHPASQSELLLADRTETYTGQPYSLLVSGLTPSASVTYTLDGEHGNSAVDAGEYAVQALVTRPNYADTTLSATLIINRARSFILGDENQVHSYDGTAKTLTVELNHTEGTLALDPPGPFTDAGTYAVTASTPQTRNYQAESKTFTLRIDKAPISGITLESRRFVYDGERHELTISGMPPEGAVVNYTNNARTEVGTQTVTATVSGDDYEPLVLTATLEISHATRTLKFPALPAKTYGDTDFFAGATASTGETIHYTSSDPAVAEITNSGRIRIVGAGTAVITATVPVNENYSNRPEQSRTLTVAKANQVITLSAPPEVGRDAGTVHLGANASSDLPVSLAIDDTEVATLEGDMLHIHRLGTVRITATQAGDANHEAAPPQAVTVRVIDPNSDFPVRVNKAVSPNGDGINEYLVVEAIKDHPDNRVSIFNRNGTVVYEASGYNNGTVAFRGIGTGQHRVPAGTYFYVAEVKVGDKWEYEKGWFVLRY